jgi:HK97 family phage major capsid protein
MNLKALRQAKADNDKLQASLRAEGRQLMAVATPTPEQTARMSAAEQELDAAVNEAKDITANIARAEKFAQDDIATATRVEVGQDRTALAPWGPEVAANEPAYRQAEARHVALGRFAQAVRMAGMGQGVDSRLQAAATGGGTQTDSNLGFAIPSEVAPGIERDMFEGGEILSRVDTRTVTGNSIAYNILDETSRADSSRGGGVLGYWVDEGTAPTASNTKLSRVELKLKKVGAFGVMTDELLEDAAALGGELEAAFASELIFQTENKIYRGNGSSAPQGFLNAACLVSVAKESGQAAATINTKNLSKMWARMPASSKRNAVWLINVDCEPQLDELTLAAGTGGLQPRFVNYSNEGILTIKGRPVVAVEYAESVGTQGDIALVDLAKYRLIRKGGVQQASSMHVYFAQGEQAFRAFYRVDGQAMPRAAKTPFKGSATLSPFVVLDTRA